MYYYQEKQAISLFINPYMFTQKTPIFWGFYDAINLFSYKQISLPKLQKITILVTCFIFLTNQITKNNLSSSHWLLFPSFGFDHFKFVRWQFNLKPNKIENHSFLIIIQYMLCLSSASFFFFFDIPTIPQWDQPPIIHFVCTFMSWIILQPLPEVVIWNQSRAI